MNSHCRQTAGSHPPARRGAVLIAVIVCVVVGSAVFLSILKMTAAGRNVLQSESQRIQAEWLAESALQRAAARLAADPDYAGETWNVSAVGLSMPQSAKVRIDVEPVAGRADRRLVRVRADYPDHPHYRVRYEKQTVVHAPSPDGEEP
ncbi:MAG: hypothetical protein HQ567_26005 [Candidatus Nealsonbacteria bacterium]|nr:hypothetical protein [Candidatus Nealsonbacteria bacterium]